MYKNRIEATFVVSICTIAIFYLILSITLFVFGQYYEYEETTIIESIYESIDSSNKKINDDIKYFILYTNDNEITKFIKSERQENLDEDIIDEFINATLEDDVGNIKNYRFKVFNQENQKIIISLNCKNDFDTLEIVFKLLIYIFMGIALFIIAVFSIFSSLFFRPFYKNIQQQKEFITNASHDLKTPLAIISANAEVLQMTMKPNEWLDNIISEIKDMNKLIEGLLLLAKADETNTKLPKMDISISNIVADILKSFEERFSNKNITLKTNIGNINYYGNEFEIRQLITLLLDNAIKYSTENGIINIDIKEWKSKIYLNFYNTTDTTNIDTKKIFNRFYRSKKNRNRLEGHGIGLSVVQNIVNRNKGTIKAQKEEEGIVFRIILPNKIDLKTRIFHFFHKNNKN